jgi:hypothetical protein
VRQGLDALGCYVLVGWLVSDELIERSIGRSTDGSVNTSLYTYIYTPPQQQQQKDPKRYGPAGADVLPVVVLGEGLELLLVVRLFGRFWVLGLGLVDWSGQCLWWFGVESSEDD